MVLSAVIFDLNGTILEDEDEYGKAFNVVLKSLGIDSKTDYPQTKGIGVKENWLKLIEKYKITTEKTPEILAKETQDEYLAQISEISVRPGFTDFVEHLKERGVEIALATSNTWEITDKILDTVNLQGVFDAVTTGDEVLYNKPDPEIFTLAADKLGVERYECLVVEDSASGVEAGLEAGMKVVAISSTGEDLKELSKANYTVEGFSEITEKIIVQL